jgi:dolichol-phosphate mannosyltransferase
VSGPAIWIVLPAYNEAAALPALLEAVTGLPRQWTWHVIVVDDGSSDGTADAARLFEQRLRLDVLAHPRNLGLAAALRTGLEAACRRAAPSDVIVTMDADNTHRPEQIPAMVGEIERNADIVIASRYVRGARQAGVPPHRAVLSAGIGWLLRLRFGLPGVRDYSCGFRAYRAGILQQALASHGTRLIESAGFVAMTEVLVKLAPFRPRIMEVPLDLRYDRKIGPSKMPTGRTVAGYLGLILARSRRI